MGERWPCVAELGGVWYETYNNCSYSKWSPVLRLQDSIPPTHGLSLREWMFIFQFVCIQSKHRSWWKSCLPRKSMILGFLCFVLNHQCHSTYTQWGIGRQTLALWVLFSISIIVMSAKIGRQDWDELVHVLGRLSITHLGVCWAKSNGERSVRGLKALNYFSLHRYSCKLPRVGPR